MFLASLFFVWTNASLSLLAWRVMRRSFPRSDRWTRAVVALLVFVATAQLTLVLLAALGLLSALGVALLVTTLLVVEARLPRSASAEPEALAEPPPSVSSWLPVGVVVGLFLWWGASVLGHGVLLTWDDLAYHAPIPAWWLQTGSLAPPPLTYQAYYPLGAELVSLWFQVPYGGDVRANLVVLLWVALVLVSGASLARALGYPAAATAAVLTCFLVSPETIVFRSTFTANDLAVAGLGLAALALSGPVRAARSWLPGLACGVAAGLALGTKVSILPLALLIGLFRLDRLRRGEETRASLAAFALGLVVAGSGWYLRNLFLTGNPLFPAELGPFEGPFSADAQRKTSLLPTLLAGGARPAFWLEFLRARLDWPLSIGLVAVAGYAGGAWAALRSLRAPRGRHLLLVLACGLALLLLFPLQPFSGTTNRPASDIIQLPRYLAFPFLLGLLLLPALARGRAARWVALGAFGAACGAAATLGLGPLPWIGAGILLVAFGLRVHVPGRLLVPVGCLLVLVALALDGQRAARRATENLYAFPDTWVMWQAREDPDSHPVGRGWEAIEALPDGSRLAWIGNLPSSHAFTYPLFGRRRQHEVVLVTGRGEQRAPLHEGWRDEPSGWWWEFEELGERVLARDLRHGLRAAEVDFVLVTKWPRARRRDWPAARTALMEELGVARRVSADGYTEVWDVRADGRQPGDPPPDPDGE